MSTFQTGQAASISRLGERGLSQLYPGNRKSLKGSKNNPGVLQRYVTYDTLPGSEFCEQRIFTILKLRKVLQ
jgi:hypothetical protein